MDLTTKLTDRVLRFDGTSEVNPDDLARFLLLGVPPSKMVVSVVTTEVEQFNFQAAEQDQIRTSAGPVMLDMKWEVPQKYLDLDLGEYVISRFDAETLGYDEPTTELAIQRIADELEEVVERGMSEFVRTVIYILDTLRANNVVWGVGRGSSCASYVLFLIGLHTVDCVKYDVPLEEFFH